VHLSMRVCVYILGCARMLFLAHTCSTSLGFRMVLCCAQRRREFWASLCARPVRGSFGTVRTLLYSKDNSQQ